MKNGNESNIPIIKNKKQLISHGNIEGRKVALDIIEHGLKAIDTYEATKRLIRFDGEILKVGHLQFDLSEKEDIYVIGAGKASFPIAKALEDILGERIKEGIVIEKRDDKLKRIKVIKGGHPLPDEAGYKWAKKIMELATKIKRDDLVFCPITGGSSALMTLPAEGISLKDVQTMTDLLLKSGASIKEINAVRKHISAIKGGRLAVAIHPAEIINLTVSDVIGDWDVLDVITGPTVPDTSTFVDAVSTLKKYKLWDETPPLIREHLHKADPRFESPKDFTGMRVHTFMLSTNGDICDAAKKRAEELGFNAAILSTMMEGESREVGITLAGISKETEKHDRPFAPPIVMISGGETTVTIEDECGEGGPNQEFVLGFSLKITGNRNITVASIGTDGTDGPTDIAGGIADGYTLRRAREKGIDIFKNLMSHNASYVLERLGDAIYTYPTGTNVMDLRLIVLQSSDITRR
ncbi:MAG: glycerate kinase [Methanomicrobia archaeon]|nr:glycerate kinase [Methanomicrobia archaeon]